MHRVHHTELRCKCNPSAALGTRSRIGKRSICEKSKNQHPKLDSSRSCSLIDLSVFSFHSSHNILSWMRAAWSSSAVAIGFENDLVFAVVENVVASLSSLRDMNTRVVD